MGRLTGRQRIAEAIAELVTPSLSSITGTDIHALTFASQRISYLVHRTRSGRVGALAQTCFRIPGIRREALYHRIASTFAGGSVPGGVVIAGLDVLAYAFAQNLIELFILIAGLVIADTFTEIAVPLIIPGTVGRRSTNTGTKIFIPRLAVAATGWSRNVAYAGTCILIQMLVRVTTSVNIRAHAGTNIFIPLLAAKTGIPLVAFAFT